MPVSRKKLNFAIVWSTKEAVTSLCASNKASCKYSKYQVVTRPACKKAWCSEFAYPDNCNCFMAGKQGKKDYPTMCPDTSGLPTTASAQRLSEEIRSQKTKIRICPLFSDL